MINRTYVIQNLLKQTRGKTYLEIGVRRGNTFLQIKAKKKLGVDPRFLISKKQKISSYFSNPSNIYNHYFAMTSDDFFTCQKSLLEKVGLDVVFIDGLHTYQQSLCDVENSLKYLNSSGIIILHDCNPASSISAMSSYEDATAIQSDSWDRGWSGDVWKTIVHLRAKRRDVTAFVLDCDSGLGIVVPKASENQLKLTTDQIQSLSYEDLNRERNQLLNLKSPDYFTVFLEQL